MQPIHFVNKKVFVGSSNNVMLTDWAGFGLKIRQISKTNRVTADFGIT